jgi:hypothetical protein
MPLRPVTRHLLRPDILVPDSALGLNSSDFAAFEKTGDDLPGDGSNGTRRWDQHIDF